MAQEDLFPVVLRAKWTFFRKKSEWKAAAARKHRYEGLTGIPKNDNKSDMAVEFSMSVAQLIAVAAENVVIFFG